jgi:hypothetical protein
VKEGRRVSESQNGVENKVFREGKQFQGGIFSRFSCSPPPLVTFQNPMQECCLSGEKGKGEERVYEIKVLKL